MLGNGNGSHNGDAGHFGASGASGRGIGWGHSSLRELGLGAILVQRSATRWVARTARGSGEWHPDNDRRDMPGHRFTEMNVAGIACGLRATR